MTVCIAALSTYIDTQGAQHSVIVLAADRMITARRIREYELADQTKMMWFRGNVAVLMSGSTDALNEAYVNVWQRVEKGCTVQHLTNALAEEVQAIRRRDVERQFLSPHGLTVDSFISRQKEWSPDFFERLSNQMGDDDNDLGEIIVAGFDTLEGQEYAQIYTIEGPGWERHWSITGYCAIGIGAQHAEAEFAHAGYSPKREWVNALRIAFFAKKRAEEAPGVGSSTDLWHITEGGARYYPPLSKVVEELDGMFRSTRFVERKSIGDDAERIGKTITEEGYGSVKEPGAATEKERQAAEAEAERADAAADQADVSGGAEEGQRTDGKEA